LDEQEGIPVSDTWDDIPIVAGSERTGYPTQKPLALLERIIKASSNEGDVVLDPFCGCATALIAAEKLERQWLGIDISPAAKRLVKSRMEREIGLFGLQTVYRDDIPLRTDMGKLPSPQTHKHTLYGAQEGVCIGCKIMFPFKNMTIDHIVPQSKGGSDHIGNLQLLCNACNSMKGSKSQEEFLAALAQAGV
jgi:site-specific DNA-methyltransferase (adenine-specific)